ncbi:Uncharacterized protein OnM2_077066 [Erysiphe neolycopersici]|uniref:Plasma membrane channel protein n=1 Tax=Erysiphe neolycopersici TaxID=212602 RepID=A0A420HI00_9PEZI|nr:Uncharacterized protein OnM2_077066 [Erysiphe neolycopersici]
MATSDLNLHNDSRPNFDVDYVIRYNITDTTKHQAEKQFTKLIESLQNVGLTTEVRYGGAGFILIFVRIASLQNLEKLVFRSRIYVWLYDVRNEIPLQIMQRNLREVSITEAERLRTIYLLITGTKAEGGIGITPNFGDWKNVASIFPLHDYEFNKEITRKLNSKYILDAKTLSEIKDHFGDRIALYFTFLQSYLMFLIFPAGIGLFAWIFLGQYSPIFAGLNTLWSIIFVEFWKKQEKHLASQWKSYDDSINGYRYPELEHMITHNDPLIDRRIRTLSPLRRFLRQTLQIPFVIAATIMLGGLIATCFGIEIFITEVYSGHFKKYMVLLPTIILSTMMPIVSTLLKKSALKLTDFENYESPSSYETSMVQKIFVLNFISSYLPIFLTAFVYVPFGHYLVPRLNFLNLIFKYSSNTNNQIVSQDNVFRINPDRLKSQVIYFTVTAQIINFGLEVIYPYIRRKLFSRIKNVQLSRSIRYDYENTEPIDNPSEFLFLAQARKEADMEKYDLTSDFREMIVQFGYLSLFSVVWPLTAISFLINNWIEIRSDAIKITMETQRPIPLQTISIRPWINALGFLSWLGSLTTAALVYLFSENVLGSDGTPDNIKAWRLLLTIFISEHIYLATKLVVKKIISNLHSFEHRVEESQKLKTRKTYFEKIINENSIGKFSSQTIYDGTITKESVTRDHILNHQPEDSKNMRYEFWQCQFNVTKTIELGKNFISMAKSRESKKEL